MTDSLSPETLEREARAYDAMEAYDARVGVATQEEIIRRTARAEAAKIEAGREIRLPPAQDSHSLVADLTAERPTDEFAVAGLLKRGQNATLSAQFKAGKTSLACDLARCVADGQPFLGQFETGVTGNVGFWNAEMDRFDWRDYMRPLNVTNPGRVRAWHLRGYRLPLRTDAGIDHAVDWLRDNGIGLWIIDSWARLCAWSDVHENYNDEVADLLSRLDEIKTAAGVGELLLIAHMGRAQHEPGSEHARGATVLDDWTDARWILTRDDDARFLKVEGRGGELAESEIRRDGEGRGQLVGGSRVQAKLARAVDEAVAIVAETPGLKTGDVHKKMTSTSRAPDRTAAVKEAILLGLVHARPAGNSKPLYPGPPPDVDS